MSKNDDDDDDDDGADDENDDITGGGLATISHRDRSGFEGGARLVQQILLWQIFIIIIIISIIIIVIMIFIIIIIIIIFIIIIVLRAGHNLSNKSFSARGSYSWFCFKYFFRPRLWYVYLEYNH